MRAPRGERITDAAEHLHRQIALHFVDLDRVSSQAFCPMPKDAGLLSVSAGSKIDARESLARFVARGFSSAGVMTVTAEECAAEDLGVYLDPLDADEDAGPDDAHALIDMRALSRSQQRVKAKKLASCARERGWTYRLGA